MLLNVPSPLDGPQDAPSVGGERERTPTQGRPPDTPGGGGASEAARGATRDTSVTESISRGATRESRGGGSAQRESNNTLLEQAEVRDVLAWMRLLTDPRDASAAVRALARPPIELRQVDLARVIQIARRQKLEVVAALASALESPQVPPEARERIQRFLELHRWAAGSLDTMRADLFVGRLIERLGLRRRQLLAGEGASAKRLAGLAALGELAEEFIAGSPRPTARALAAHLTAAAEGPPWTQAQRAEPQAEPEQAPGSPTGGASHDQTHARVTGGAPHERTPGDPRLGTTHEPEPAPGDPEREALQNTVEALREEVLGDVARIAGRLGELRLDTELDVSHGVVRYLELIKLAALLERPRGETVEEALEDLNARLRAAVTPLQREILESSPLDELLLAEGGEDGAQAERVRAQAVAARGEPTLEAFLPRRGEGLVLSASDVETYRSCPLRYKYARVLKIPTEQTLSQRFGIVVHQVLERFHAAQDDGERARAPAGGVPEGRELRGEERPGGERAGGERAGGERASEERAGGERAGGEVRQREAGDLEEGEREGGRRQGTLRELLELLDTAWRRSGLGERGAEGELWEKAQVALRRYHERLERERAQPLWFERSFAFTLGPHHVRGRVDRVDALPEGGYELIDYKTGYAKTAEELGEDIQLSLYAIAAREAWGLEETQGAYYYVLDDCKVPVPRNGADTEWVRGAVLEAGAGILAQDFEPTPSPAVCARCDYRIACPAAER